MGADLTTYLVFGFKAKKEELKKRNLSLRSEKFLPYIEGHPGIIDTLVSDLGDSFVFGRRLSHLDADKEGINQIQYQDITLDAENHRLILSFIDLFGEDVYLSLEEKEPVLMHFNHWS